MTKQNYDKELKDKAKEGEGEAPGEVLKKKYLVKWQMKNAKLDVFLCLFQNIKL